VYFTAGPAPLLSTASAISQRPFRAHEKIAKIVHRALKSRNALSE